MLFSDALSDLAISVTLLLFLSYYQMLTWICFIKRVTHSIPCIICYHHVVLVNNLRSRSHYSSNTHKKSLSCVDCMIFMYFCVIPYFI